MAESSNSEKREKDKNLGQSVSVDVLASLLLLSPRQVQSLARKGVIKKNTNGKYLLVPSIQGYIEYKQTQARRGLSDDEEQNIHHVRIETEKTKLALLKAQTRLEEQKADKAEGKLIDVDVATAVAVNIIMVSRSRLLAIPSKVAAQVAKLKTPKEVKQSLDKEIHQALTDLSEGEIQFTESDESS